MLPQDTDRVDSISPHGRLRFCQHVRRDIDRQKALDMPQTMEETTRSTANIQHGDGAPKRTRDTIEHFGIVLAGTRADCHFVRLSLASCEFSVKTNSLSEDHRISPVQDD
jgi:hypothetical protein